MHTEATLAENSKVVQGCDVRSSANMTVTDLGDSPYVCPYMYNCDKVIAYPWTNVDLSKMAPPQDI